MRKQPTGEPCAGEPHARFGGRGGASLPYPYLDFLLQAGFDFPDLQLDGLDVLLQAGFDFPDLQLDGLDVLLQAGFDFLDVLLQAGLDFLDVLLQTGLDFLDFFLQPQLGLAHMALGGEVVEVWKPSLQCLEGIGDEARTLLVVRGFGEFGVEVEGGAHGRGSRVGLPEWDHSIQPRRRMRYRLSARVHLVCGA
jgi:hypothetical protein